MEKYRFNDVCTRLSRKPQLGKQGGRVIWEIRSVCFSKQTIQYLLGCFLSMQTPTASIYLVLLHIYSSPMPLALREHQQKNQQSLHRYVLSTESPFPNSQLMMGGVTPLCQDSELPSLTVSRAHQPAAPEFFVHTMPPCSLMCPQRQLVSRPACNRAGC